MSLENVRKNPTSSGDRIKLAEELWHRNESYPAIVQREIALELGRQEVADVLQLASIYESAGETEEAVRILVEASNRPNATNELLIRYIKTLLKSGEFYQAARVADRLTSTSQTLSDNDRRSAVRSYLLAAEPERAGKFFPKSPKDSSWSAAHGLYNLLMGRPKLALADFMKVNAAQPSDSWNIYQMGLASLQSGDMKEAGRIWQRGAVLKDAPVRSRTGLAKIYLLNGALTNAEVALKSIGKSGEEDPDYWNAWRLIANRKGQQVQESLSRGYVAFFSGDPWLAETIWLKTMPNSQGEDARELYAAVYNSAFRRHDMDTAYRIASLATSLWPHDSYFLKRKAEVLLGQNLLEPALAEAEELKKIAPPSEEPEVTELLSRIGLDSGKPDILNESAKRHLELAPEDPDPLLHLAEWQAQKGRSKENLEATLDIYQKAIKIAPMNAESYARAGGVLLDLKRFQDAIAMLNHALSLSPDVLDGAPHAQLAQAFQQQGMEYERRLEERFYQKKRKAKEGWPVLLKSLRKNGSLKDWRELGEMALNRRENWIALCAFNRCVKLVPHDIISLRSLATVYKRLGRFDDALKTMQIASSSGKKRELN